jgi:hypothetical protein
MPYRRRYYWRGRRQTSPQETADQTSRELYWQFRREIGTQSQSLRLKFSDHLTYGIISTIISVPIVGFLFWFVFSPGPYRGWARDETMHAVVVLVILVSSIGLPGAVINQLLWPRILKIAGFVVVAGAFYFGLKARANLLYVIPYFLCCWI